MKTLFIINDEGYHQSAKIVDKLLHRIDNAIKDAVVKFDIVEDYRDDNIYKEFKDASMDDDYDVYILNFVHYKDDYDNITKVLKTFGYNQNTTSIIMLKYSDIEKYKKQIDDYITGAINPMDIEF